MTHVFNDGGRSAAGFRGKTGDCVARSICIITGRPYAEVYAEVAKINAAMPKTKRRKKGKVGSETAAHGIYTKSALFKRYMVEHGFVWTPTIRIGSGCLMHLRASELPRGRIIAKVSRHYVAVIDGVINDTYDCSREGTRCVYGIWRLAKK
jgi:hypothetical protein